MKLYILSILFLFTVGVIIRFNKKVVGKPLTALIFENDSIETIKIYKEVRVNGEILYSVDINNQYSYDYLSEKELRNAIIIYPKPLKY